MGLTLADVNPTKNALQRALSLEPALIRGAVVAVTGVVAVVIGKQVDISWLENALDAYSSLSALLAAYLIRGKVFPQDKVVTYLEDVTKQSTLAAGPAVFNAEVDSGVLPATVSNLVELSSSRGRHAA